MGGAEGGAPCTVVHGSDKMKLGWWGLEAAGRPCSCPCTCGPRPICAECSQDTATSWNTRAAKARLWVCKRTKCCKLVGVAAIQQSWINKSLHSLWKLLWLYNFGRILWIAQQLRYSFSKFAACITHLLSLFSWQLLFKRERGRHKILQNLISTDSSFKKGIKKSVYAVN